MPQEKKAKKSVDRYGNPEDLEATSAKALENPQ